MEVGLERVEAYVLNMQNKSAQYIVVGMILDL